MNSEAQDKIKSYLDWALIGRSARWLYVTGVVLIFLTLLVFMGLLALPLKAFVGSLVGPSPAGAFVTLHLGFIFLWLLPPLFVWLAHRRPGWSVALPRRKFEGWNLGMGMLFSGLRLLTMFLIPVLFGGVKLSFTPPDLQVYVPFLIAALVMFFIQTSAEELAFRGYMMQAVRRFTPLPVIIIFVTGILFALPHVPNMAGQHLAWYGILLYMIDGWLLGWLAYRSRSLWMPIGWHFANNLLYVTVINTQGGGDVVQGFPFILADKSPDTLFLVVAKASATLIFVAILAWLISRREKKQSNPV